MSEEWKKEIEAMSNEELDKALQGTLSSDSWREAIIVEGIRRLLRAIDNHPQGIGSVEHQNLLSKPVGAESQHAKIKKEIDKDFGCKDPNNPECDCDVCKKIKQENPREFPKSKNTEEKSNGI